MHSKRELAASSGVISYGVYAAADALLRISFQFISQALHFYCK